MRIALTITSLILLRPSVFAALLGAWATWWIIRIFQKEKRK